MPADAKPRGAHPGAGLGLGCAACKAPNRDIAKYCKKCGQELAQPALRIDELVGMDAVKQQLQGMVSVVQGMEKARKSGQTVPKNNLNTVIIGNAGTGKSKVAAILASVFHQYGITTKKNPDVVNAVDYAEFAKDFEQNFQKAKGGILFVDNVQKLVPAGYSTDVDPLDKLFAEMDKSAYDPIVILAGLPKGFREYLNGNPSVKRKFGHVFELPDYDHEQLYKIAVLELSRHGLSLAKDAEDAEDAEGAKDAETRFKNLLRHLVRTRDDSFDNGHLALRQAQNVANSYYQRVAAGAQDDNVITAEDVKGEVPEERTADSILAELDSFIGMESIKSTVRELISQVRFQQERMRRGLAKDEKVCMHLVLTGNPGTGKTTVARKLGEVFQAIGFLDRGHVVEVDKSKLVGQYVGETPKLVTKCCDDAMGGILFIDEAYALAPDTPGNVDPYGKEAIETLLKRMEDDRGKFVVIAAGYKDQMARFLGANPGLRSRFDRELHFEDYKPDELLAILKVMASSKKYKVSVEAEAKLAAAFKDMYDRRDRDFGNGREVRKLFEETVRRLSVRVSGQLGGTADDAALTTIRADDVAYEVRGKREMSLGEVLGQLDRLVGLSTVKTEVRKIVNYLRVEQARAVAGGKATPLNLHFVFRGNPGTGKTTVARVLADAFRAMGLLSKGHLVEVERSGLVGQYVGHTAPKTNAVIDSALGGVLFIDEAYALSRSTSGSDFGQEAIDTLLKRMEDDRGKFIVIAAGYSDEMEQFVNSNPGLSSRFTKYIDFDDYTPEEMKGIFRSMAEAKGMVLEPGVEPVIEALFRRLYEKRGRSFANGRTVRNLFETALQNQAGRLVSKGDVGGDVLKLITADDVASLGNGTSA